MTGRTNAQPVTEAGPVAAPALQRACGCGASAGVSGECPQCSASEKLGVQPKLTISQPGDRYEEEADRIADQVVSDRPAPVQAALSVTPLLQRQPEEEEEEELQMKPAAGQFSQAAPAIQRQVEEEEEEEELLQPKPANAHSSQVTPSIQRQAEEEEEEELLQPKPASGQSLRPTATPAQSATRAVSSGGRPLSMEMRGYFEPRFGTDLSGVRIHDGPRAADAARIINARAYTLGHNIAFAAGEFSPHTTEGRRLMAHELAHTLQQTRGRAPAQIRRSPQQQPAGGAVSTPHLNLLQATMEMCRRSDTAAILARIDADNVEIRFFREAYDKWRLADGTEEEVDLSTRLRGNTFIDPTSGRGIIRLNERLSSRDMVITLFHEMQHWIHRQTPTGPRGLESEIQARIDTEQMAIDRGWPETRPNYRTPDGRVNEAHIRQQMEASPHYSPQGRTRIGRRYDGETTVPGPFACPPVGDFPEPSGTERFA